MVTEMLEIFESAPSGVFLDATLGDGGHAEAILSARKDIKLVGIDRDTAAIGRAKQRLAPLAERCHFVHSDFEFLGKKLDELEMGEISGAIFDLGVSSEHLDNPERGFSFRSNGPLDMRMDQTQNLDAAEIVNHTTETELADILYEYGDERFSRRIAAAIVKNRPVVDTHQLAEVVIGAVSSRGSKSGGHPARRTFQALRIKVNGELSQIRPALVEVAQRLLPDGRGAVLSYHSGEDRIVKQFLREKEAENGDQTEPHGDLIKQLNRKVRKPTRAEIADNPRAKSARLRAFKKVGTFVKEA